MIFNNSNKLYGLFLGLLLLAPNTAVFGKKQNLRGGRITMEEQQQAETISMVPSSSPTESFYPSSSPTEAAEDKIMLGAAAPAVTPETKLNDLFRRADSGSFGQYSNPATTAKERILALLRLAFNGGISAANLATFLTLPPTTRTKSNTAEIFLAALLDIASEDDNATKRTRFMSLYQNRRTGGVWDTFFVEPSYQSPNQAKSTDLFKATMDMQAASLIYGEFKEHTTLEGSNYVASVMAHGTYPGMMPNEFKTFTEVRSGYDMHGHSPANAYPHGHTYSWARPGQGHDTAAGVQQIELMTGITSSQQTSYVTGWKAFFCGTNHQNQYNHAVCQNV